MGKYFPSKFHSPALILSLFSVTSLFLNSAFALTIRTSEPKILVGQEFSSIKTGENSVLVTKCESSASQVVFSAEVKSLNLAKGVRGAVWRIEDEGIAGVDGMPDLPAISRWVVVPPTGEITLSATVQHQSRHNAEPPARFRDNEGEEEDFAVTEETTLTGVWPPQVAIIGEPMVWRGVRMVNLVLYPVQWDAETQDYIVNEGIVTEIVKGDSAGVNEVVPGYREPCRDFDKALEALVVNPPVRDDADENYPPGSYLIVANEDYPAAVNELVEWKRQAGHKVQILTFDPRVITKVMLKNQIRDIYNESHFSYLILIGNEEVDPPLEIPYDPEFYDNYFGQLDGNDPIADVAVGTYNCLTVDNLTCAIRRTISYEKNPDIENRVWFSKGFVGVGHCSVPEDLSPSYSGKWVKSVLERKGYDVTSTFFSDNEDNDFSPEIAELYNDGVNMIIVRGHQNDFDPQDIGAHGVYPFHFMVSSSTISQGGWGSFNRTFRMGTPDVMRGPSAGFGHNPSPRTNIANAIVGGLAEGLFEKGIRSFGWARNYLTAKIPIVMPADQGQLVTRYWGTLRYYGDPGQEPWIGVPSGVEVDGDDLWTGQSALNLRVRRQNQVVSGATVTLYAANQFQVTGITDANGRVVLAWDNPEFERQQPILTVTGEGIYPFQRQLEPRDGVRLVVTDYEVLDETNNEVELNPGDRIGLSVTYSNIGNVPTMENEENWEFASPFIAGQFVPVRVPALDPGESIVIELEPVEDDSPRVSSTTPNKTQIHTCIRNDFAGISFEVLAPDLVREELILEGELIPAGAVRLWMTLQNNGDSRAVQVSGRLSTTSGFIDIIDERGLWDDIGIGETMEEIDNFSFSINEDAIPGSVAEFVLEIDTDTRSGMKIPIQIKLEEREAQHPVGPDKYGYIGIENGDENTVWADAPVFDWIDINPLGGEFEGERLDFPAQGEEDSSVVIDLPFVFGYYGQGFRQITVCNNGWIAMGDQSGLKNQQNWPLPGYNGAWGMIAPFWDRLFMQTQMDGVFIYFDEQNHKIIIQWQTGTKDDDRNWFANAFQVVLFDPAHHETATGDGPILFQYNTVNDVQGDFEANFKCSVGISSPDGKDGLTYSYWGMPAVGARNLAANQAVLWTTTVWEPRATIEGRVVRYIDSTAVAGAVVTTSHGYQTLTNDEGDYRIVAPGAEGLTVSTTGEGYGEASADGIEMVVGEVVRQDFVLPHGWFSLPDSGLSPGTNPGNMDTRGHIEWTYPDTVNIGWFSIEPIEFTIAVEQNTDFFEQIDATGLPDGEYEVELHYIVDDPQVELIRNYRIVVNDVKDPPETFPVKFALDNPYPNPFNSQTSLKFSLPVSGQVELSLTDIGGREVISLASAEFGAGTHQLTLGAGDLPTGLYLIRMEAGAFKASERVLLIR